MSSWDDYLDSPVNYDDSLVPVRGDTIWPEATVKALTGLNFSDDFSNSAKPTNRTQATPEFYGELENRKLEISGFDHMAMTKDILLTAAAQYGAVESVEVTANKAYVTFYDMRDAYAMRRAKICVGQYPWLIQFAILEKVVDRKSVPNNGTIVVFKLGKRVTDEEVRPIYEKFGEIRDLRSTPEKGTQRFIEYWDLRDAQRARDATDGQRILGSKVRVEFSIPGGIRRNPSMFRENRLPTISRAVKREAISFARPAIAHQCM